MKKENARRGWHSGRAVGEPGLLRDDGTPSAQAVQLRALAVRKRGRWVKVAKIVEIDDQPALAVVHRTQGGPVFVSLPTVVVEYAEKVGCRWLHVRRDETDRTGR